MPSIRVSCSLLLLAAAALAVPADRLEKRAPPTVTLDQGTFVGEADGDVNNFLGIPFGKPPYVSVSSHLAVWLIRLSSQNRKLAFQSPVAVDAYTGTYNVSAYGPSCPQQAQNLAELPSDVVDYANTTMFASVETSDEDCLSLNVIVPNGAQIGDDLPVAVVGGSSMYGERGVVVKRSIAMNEPTIFVSMNYRKEVKEAGVGNLGLQDQRLALHWVQKYISQFGGDPSKVTIWGESAGAISVAMHMITNGGDTEGLFRGAFMQSGSPIPVGDIEHGQGDYDAIAVDASPSIFSYQSLRLAWLPRQLVLDGSVADVPFVSGFAQYIKEIYVPDITDAELDTLLSAYPATSPRAPVRHRRPQRDHAPVQAHRAFQGDLVFNAARRFFIQQRADDQPVYSFLSKRFKWVPTLGSVHASDLLNVFGPAELTDYLVNFANNLDPNGATVPVWPQYSVAEPQLMTFVDGLRNRTEITTDDFRNESMAYVVELALKYPL
ncbi:carotenoid ester lipase precursor [Epithele typhae]|uniref:carotenoid ester lipase precursor n=1 Tax=Epithele typhae TaxID=378194 RepID=UPI002008BF01|nr:carotenoid ester lipase precursor [Epithele typhae]KAH9907098.1 carotenoid ester lipase precursor [Epithele typhae]